MNPETMRMMSRSNNTGPGPHSRYKDEASRNGCSKEKSMMSRRGMSSSPRRYYERLVQTTKLKKITS